MKLILSRRSAASLFLSAVAASCALPKLEFDKDYPGQVVATGGTLAGGAGGLGGSGALGGKQPAGTGGNGTGAVATGGRPQGTGADTGVGAGTGAGTGGVTTASGGTGATAGMPSGGGGITSVTGGTHAGGNSSGGTGTVTPPPACLGNPLPMPANGWVASTSNGCGIQGQWYWIKDSPTVTNPFATTVTVPATADASPVAVGGGKVCLQGSTVEDGLPDSEFTAWGATLSLDLNSSGTVASSYDATAHDIGGFEVKLTGNFPQGVRVSFAPLEESAQVAAPFVVFFRPGVYRVRFDDAFVPMDWTWVTNPGKAINQKQVARLKFTIVGGSLAEAFNYCVESVIPLPRVDDGSLGLQPVRFVPLPIDVTAAFDAASNAVGIQGEYACHAPEGSTFQCGDPATPGPYRAAAKSMCVSGEFTGADTEWGANLGLSLNQVPASDVLGSFDAKAKNLRGFRVDNTGTTSDFPVRLAIASVASFPESEVGPGATVGQPGSHLVHLGSMTCPDWSNTTCTDLDPAKLYFTQLEFPSPYEVKEFSLCLAKIDAIVDR